MKKTKKKFKGMSLVEVIVALAVFAIFGLLLCGIGQSIAAHRKIANSINHKVAEQSAVAEIEDTGRAFLNDPNGVTPEVMISLNLDTDNFAIIAKAWSVVDPQELAVAGDVRGEKLSLRFITEAELN